MRISFLGPFSGKRHNNVVVAFSHPFLFLAEFIPTFHRRSSVKSWNKMRRQEEDKKIALWAAMVYRIFMRYDLCVIGGAGHVGLPLGVAFANKKVTTVLFDINKKWLAAIASGQFPFREKNGDKELQNALGKKCLFISDDPGVIAQSKFVVLVIGTPVDEYLNPDFNGLMRVLDKYLLYFRSGQVLILRSTVYPGISERLREYFGEKGLDVRVAFCPERIAQGRSLEELAKLPQIISAFDADTLKATEALFRKLTPNVIVAGHPIEAELAKLFSNAWRYIKFAVANQFYMIAEEHGMVYHRIYEAMVKDYERNRELPPPGFAAGPCLFKDTMQLAAFHNNTFFLGHAAMLVNEGLPNFIVRHLQRKFSAGHGVTSVPPHRSPHAFTPMGVLLSARTAAGETASPPPADLRHKTVGILGMAFKAESDDPRDSLSYKLRKILSTECKQVLCHDVYIKDATFRPLKEVISASDVVILAAPHRAYRAVNPRHYPDKLFVDIWNFWRVL